MEQRKMMIVSIMAIFILGLFVAVFDDGSGPTGYLIKGDPLEFYMDYPQEAMDEYNANIENVPGFVKAIFGDERINADITLDNGSVIYYGVLTKKGIIISIDKQHIGNATLLVYTSEPVLRSLIDSENQVDDLKKALENKDITYKAVRIKTKAKAFFAKTFLKAYSFFG